MLFMPLSPAFHAAWWHNQEGGHQFVAQLADDTYVDEDGIVSPLFEDDGFAIWPWEKWFRKKKKREKERRKKTTASSEDLYVLESNKCNFDELDVSTPKWQRYYNNASRKLEGYADRYNDNKRAADLSKVTVAVQTDEFVGWIPCEPVNAKGSNSGDSKREFILKNTCRPDPVRAGKKKFQKMFRISSMGIGNSMKKKFQKKKKNKKKKKSKSKSDSNSSSSDSNSCSDKEAIMSQKDAGKEDKTTSIVTAAGALDEEIICEAEQFFYPNGVRGVDKTTSTVEPTVATSCKAAQDDSAFTEAAEVVPTESQGPMHFGLPECTDWPHRPIFCRFNKQHHGVESEIPINKMGSEGFAEFETSLFKGRISLAVADIADSELQSIFDGRKRR